MSAKRVREGRERRLSLPVIPAIDVILLACIIGAGQVTAQSWEINTQEAAIEEETSDQASFWAKRASELCISPASPPALLRDGTALDQIENFRRQRAYRDSVWAAYADCVEERIEVIDERLLRFSYDRFDAFDMTPEEVEQAKHTIRDLVDRNAGRRRIFVRGHTDQRGSEEYNYQLSARRAWYVAEVVLLHLRAQGLVAGRDFDLIPEGLGESQLVPGLPGETPDEVDSRCRRIELAFQRARGSGRRP